MPGDESAFVAVLCPALLCGAESSGVAWNGASSPPPSLQNIGPSPFNQPITQSINPSNRQSVNRMEIPTGSRNPVATHTRALARRHLHRHVQMDKSRHAGWEGKAYFGVCCYVLAITAMGVVCGSSGGGIWQW